MQKVKRVFGLHIRRRIAYEPIPKSTQCTPKIENKSDVCQVHTFFHQKHEKHVKKKNKNNSHRYPHVVGSNGAGAPWGTLGNPVCFFDTKSASKALQK